MSTVVVGILGFLCIVAIICMLFAIIIRIMPL